MSTFNLRSQTGICLSICLLLFGLPMTSNAQERLSLGIYPYLQSTEIIKMYSPLAEYLAGRTGIPVDIVIARDYGDHVEKVGND